MQLFVACPSRELEAGPVHALTGLALALGYDAAVLHDVAAPCAALSAGAVVSRSVAVDAPSSLLLVPEACLDLLGRFSNVRRAVWWGRGPSRGTRSSRYPLELAALDPSGDVVHLTRTKAAQRALAAWGCDAQLLTPDDPDALFALLARAQATC